MRDVVNLGRLVQLNDHLIELLRWAVANNKPDYAVQLAPITKAFTSVLAKMGAKQLEVYKRRGKKKLVKKRRN